MTPEQFEQLQHSINTQLRDGIELHVNGKIRSLTAKFENYVEDDMKWKQDVTLPTLTTTGNIELGHASDTTLARSSAGNVSIEGKVIYRASGTDVVVADGGTGVSSLTAYAPIFGGTTSTGAVQSGTVGTAGQVLTSNGAGALPTFQNAGGAPCLTVIPRPQLAPTSETNGTLSSNTTAWVGQVVFPFSITVNKISIRTSFVTTGGDCKIALYSESGGTKLIDVTQTLSTSGSPAMYTFSVSSVSIPAGVYYIFLCTVGSTNATFEVYLSNTESSTTGGLNNGVGSEPVMSGTLTITAGTPPSTITPTSITAADQKTIIARFDN